jgi:hypothetical protein
MDAHTANAYLTEWAPVQWQMPTTPNPDFYEKWTLFIEAMTGIRGVEDLPGLDQYSIGNTVAIIVSRRLGKPDAYWTPPRDHPISMKN